MIASFVREADRAAREGLKKYEAAVEAQRKAEKERTYLNRGDVDYNMKKSRADYEYYQAEAAVKRIRRELENEYEPRISRIAREAAEGVVKAARVKPEDVDLAALELLKSGIMRPGDYYEMLEKYSNNTTMRRLVGKYADEAGKEAAESGDTQARAALLNIGRMGKETPDSDTVDGVNLVAEVFRRCIRNPGLISKYDELTISTTGYTPDADGE